MIKFKIIKLNHIIIVTILLVIFFTSILFIYNIVNAKSTLDNDFNNGIKVPIVMYHSILKDTSKSNTYTITPSTLENDLQYIQKNNYSTITILDLINYVYYDNPLPEKPIIITFDDGYYNNYTYAVPLLKKYNMKAVISIVGKYTDTFSETDEANANYSYLRWKDISELISDSTNTIEFQNHTYNLHGINNSRKGCMKNYNEPYDLYKNMLTKDIMQLQNKFYEKTNYTPNTFTYPYGAISKESLDIIKSLGFKASLSCSSGVNIITKNPDCLYLLKRNNRPSYISSEDFFKKFLN